MSKSMNMLRTRRRDNNVKPNRRLDRKSSRGMIYENEELRLKTININAEVERGQSDIKKLKRENEMLKKEIWCLRDEYEKLDKLLKEKDIEFSSSSTTCTTSDIESCSSCSDDSDQVETSQNFENVQKTNLKNLRVAFDHLSIVPEENSTENSDKNSTRASLPLESWNNLERHIIKPDQSYPSFEVLSKANTLPVQDRSPRHFFAPIKSSKSCDGSLNSEFFGPSSSQTLYESQSQYYLPKIDDPVHHIYENFPRNPGLDVMCPLSKSSTDLIVKMDNQNFNTLTSSSFSNGGNLEELLNDIESISQDILKLSNHDLRYNGEEISNTETQSNSKPYKSELNVVLMPTPMPLLGFEKYNSALASRDSIQHAQSLDRLTDSQNLRTMTNEPSKTPEMFFAHDNLQTSLPLIPGTTNANVSTDDLRQRRCDNPFFFGSGSADFFDARYNPDNYINKELDDFKSDEGKKGESCDSKTNLLDANSEHVSSENEENLRFRTTKIDDEAPNVKVDRTKPEKKFFDAKTPKLSIRRKVSIHFKGKKDKTTKNKSLDDLDNGKSAACEKKHSLFDIKFTTETKQKDDHQKTPSVDGPAEAKTPAASPDSRSDKRSSTNESKTPGTESKNSIEKNFDAKLERISSMSTKVRKSASVSPERKHVQVKEDGKKGHKKHRKGEKARNRRSTISNDRFVRERSYSVCTDRSNLGLGFNSAFGMYDDCANSDRERTNSISSCGSIKIRKMSNISNFPVTGKIPWCACWGNGCL